MAQCRLTTVCLLSIEKYLRITIPVMKYHDQSNLGMKGFICLILSYHCSSLKEVKTEAHTGQECRGRS